MSTPSLNAIAVPTGGAIAINVSGAVSGTATLERAASGVGVGPASGFSQIYSGPVLAYYLDVGDAQPAPLNNAWQFNYRYTDANGSGSTGYIAPAVTLVVQQDATTQILIRLLQGAINALSPPANMPKPQITQAMPLGGNIPMPLIVVNLELLQMGEIPIGQSVTPLTPLTPVVNQQIITQFANRIYRISVLTQNAEQVDFYRDAVLGIFEAIFQTVLQPLGLDVTHRWQATSGQVANDKQGMAPGFYFAEIMLEFKGTLSIQINPALQFIEEIQVGIRETSDAVTGEPHVVDQVNVPPS